MGLFVVAYFHFISNLFISRGVSDYFPQYSSLSRMRPASMRARPRITWAWLDPARWNHSCNISLVPSHVTDGPCLFVALYRNISACLNCRLNPRYSTLPGGICFDKSK